MPNYENMPEQKDSTEKLSNQALTIATTAAAGLAAAALLIESRGRALPALAEIGDSALNFLSRETKPVMKFIAEDVTGQAKSVLAEGGETAALADRKLLAEAAKPLSDMELGARPAPQYGNGTRPIETKYLGFINKWPVEGVRVYGDKVDIYVTQNHHWLELKGFDKPVGFVKPFGQSPANVQGLDILNTRISNVKVPSLNSLLSGGENQPASITLSRGSAPEIRLTGNIKATEFWH
ncbi:MAG: hypothetical protein JSS86_11645 [Cyanobacteria bacterium SZAS LIN-2]|nr:hypothetical protein [Cyanobacteria bacterium SZAS LIN-2]